MNIKNAVAVVIVFILVVLGIMAYYYYLAEPTAENEEETVIQNEEIEVTNPKLNQKIESPLAIEGEAVGNWYFEATFPVKILDANGILVAQGYVEAQGDWMTGDKVPFKGEINFSDPSTEMGFVIMEKANPSGLPENADKIEIPVSFKKFQIEGNANY